MKKSPDLVRVGSKIYYANGEMHTDCKTINKAKHASREFQKSGGQLGDGRLRVALKAPVKQEQAA